jgi:hypothetical protein
MDPFTLRVLTKLEALEEKVISMEKVNKILGYQIQGLIMDSFHAKASAGITKISTDEIREARCADDELVPTTDSILSRLHYLEHKTFGTTSADVQIDFISLLPGAPDYFLDDDRKAQITTSRYAGSTMSEEDFVPRLGAYSSSRGADLPAMRVLGPLYEYMCRSTWVRNALIARGTGWTSTEATMRYACYLADIYSRTRMDRMMTYWAHINGTDPIAAPRDRRAPWIEFAHSNLGASSEFKTIMSTAFSDLVLRSGLREIPYLPIHAYARVYWPSCASALTNNFYFRLTASVGNGVFTDIELASLILGQSMPDSQLTWILEHVELSVTGGDLSPPTVIDSHDWTTPPDGIGLYGQTSYFCDLPSTLAFLEAYRSNFQYNLWTSNCQHFVNRLKQFGLGNKESISIVPISRVSVMQYMHDFDVRATWVSASVGAAAWLADGGPMDVSYTPKWNWNGTESANWLTYMSLVLEDVDTLPADTRPSAKVTSSFSRDVVRLLSETYASTGDAFLSLLIHAAGLDSVTATHVGPAETKDSVGYTGVRTTRTGTTTKYGPDPVYTTVASEFGVDVTRDHRFFETFHP